MGYLFSELIFLHTHRARSVRSALGARLAAEHAIATLRRWTATPDIDRAPEFEVLGVDLRSRLF